MRKFLLLLLLIPLIGFSENSYNFSLTVHEKGKPVTDDFLRIIKFDYYEFSSRGSKDFCEIQYVTIQGCNKNPLLGMMLHIEPAVSSETKFLSCEKLNKPEGKVLLTFLHKDVLGNGSVNYQILLKKTNAGLNLIEDFSGSYAGYSDYLKKMINEEYVAVKDTQNDYSYHNELIPTSCKHINVPAY